MNQLENCKLPLAGRRRIFWTTQPCRTAVDACGNECADYGIELECPNGGNCVEYAPGRGRTVKTTEWVRGLVLNILLTDGRRADTSCGWRPGTRGGHWSDSFRTQPGASGSSIRYLKSHGRIADAIAELLAFVKHDLHKLVTYGVASSVEVTAEYAGANVAKLAITVFGLNGEATKVGISGERKANAWVWTE